MLKLCFAVLLTIPHVTALAAELPSSGLPYVDVIRKELSTTPTADSNYDDRRAALIGWWRLLWHQGYDMSAMSEPGWLMVRSNQPSAERNAALDQCYAILETIQANPQRIPEVHGKARPSTTATDWPMYLSTDGSNSGRSPDHGPSTGKIAWRFPKSYHWNGVPTLIDNEIYLAGPGPDVVGYRIDAQTGHTVWRARQHQIDLYAHWGSFFEPIVTDNRVVIRTGGLGLDSLVFDRHTGQRIHSETETSAEYMAFAFIQPTTKVSVVGIGNASTGKGAWWPHLDDAQAGEPVLHNNRCYIADRRGNVYCFDPNQATTVWKRALNAPLHGNLSLHGKNLVLGSDDGQVFNLNPEDGNIRWVWQNQDLNTHAHQQFSAPRIANNRVYIGSATGHVHCLDVGTGSPLWKHATDSWIRSRPLVVNNTVYVATLDSELIAIIDTGQVGQELWRKKHGAHGFTADLVGNEQRILLAGKDLMLYSVSPQDGSLQWRHGIIDGVFIEDEFIASSWMVGFMTTPSVVDGIMYLGGPDGFVNAVDVKTGREIWRFELGGVSSGVPIVADGKVFIARQADSSPRSCALDADTGDLLWETDQHGLVWVAPVYNDGMIFFGNRAGDMLGVHADSGKIAWSHYTAAGTPIGDKPRDSAPSHGFPPGVYSNPAMDDTTVYVGSWAGYYYAYDQKTGDVKWRTKTSNKHGGYPDSAAPMLHKNHLYVQKAGVYVSALHKDSGEIAWEWKAPAGYLQNGTVAASGDKIFASYVRNVVTLPYHATIVCFHDVESGSEKLWEYDGGGGLTAPVTTADQVIFGSSADMFVTSLNPEDGSVRWRAFTGGEMLENVPAIYGNKAFVQGKNGWVFAIE